VSLQNYRRETGAIDLETVANAKPDIYPEAIRMAIDYAGEPIQAVGDQEGEQRCQLGCGSAVLEDARECGQAGAKASWVMQAAPATSPHQVAQRRRR